MEYLCDKGQETLWNFSTIKLQRINKRLDALPQFLWERHGYEAYEPIARVIEDVLAFRECDEKAYRDFLRDAYGTDEFGEDV